jgi:Lrp/AsnC family leucine-responsive transcriptional regulator
VYILPRQNRSLDETDTRILEILQKDCRTPLEQIADKLGIPKSTVHYRIKRLEAEKIIEGYYAKVDATKLGKNFVTITFIRTKYGPSYHEKVGEMLAQIPGVWAAYFVFGETDFVVLARSDNSKDFMEKLERVMKMQHIERSSTQVVAKIIKEDPRIELKSSMRYDNISSA